MADIPYMQKEDFDDSDEAMEAEGGGEVWSGSTGGGDEGRGHMYHLTRLQQHASSETTFNRQMVGRILVEIFRSAANTEKKLPVEEYMKYAHQLCDDPEAPVRSDLVEQLPYIAMICQEAPHLFGDVLHDHLLGIIKKYLKDLDSQVRQTAQEALLALIKRGMIDTKTIETEICPIIENLSLMTVEYLNSGISLMSKMALLIGKELTEKVFLDRYIALCKDHAFHVRRISASYFGEICAAVGRKALLYKLFPIFVHLCLDSAWAVRKTCVDVMMPVSCSLSYPYRRILLADILATHLKDDSKWVRMSAFRILGPFISTLAKQFTNVAYNQDGELVFTSQQEDHFSNDQNNSGTTRDVTSSIRYSYEGIFPTKCAIGNQTMDSEDYDCKDVLDIGCLMEVYEHTQKNYISNLPLKAHKTKVKNGQKKQETGDEQSDSDKFNTFLYYYIPPELPPDDPLIQAAQKSSETNKSIEETSRDNEKNNGGGGGGGGDVKAIGENSETSLEGEDDREKYNSTDNQTDDSKKQQQQQQEESVDEYDDEDDSSRGSFWADDSADTIDISNLSLDKTNLNASMLLKKHESKNNKQEIVPQDLIDCFVSMAELEEFGDVKVEIPYHCAFSFPAVAFTLGKENWPYLKNAYQSLAGAKQWKVRRTLAFSIHEIAIILGEELTATDLMPIYDGFIKDLDEVRIGVLKHLATFLKILKPTDRLHYLPRLNDFLATDNEWNWRFRKELASQLLEAVTLFSAKDVAQHIASLSLQLLIDKVAAVRHVALSLVTRIVSHLSSNEVFFTGLICELKETLAFNRKKWVRRQTYALLCGQLVSDGAMSGDKFAKIMLPSLLSLYSDIVPNVRLALARTLSQNIVPMGNWLGCKNAEEVERKLEILRSDVDRDVRIFAGRSERPVIRFERDPARNIVF